jgi:hypothetical protein
MLYTKQPALSSQRLSDAHGPDRIIHAGTEPVRPAGRGESGNVSRDTDRHARGAYHFG